MLKYMQEQRNNVKSVPQFTECPTILIDNIACKGFYQFYEKNNLVNSGAPAFRPHLHLLPQEVRAEPNIIMTSAGNACRA